MLPFLIYFVAGALTGYHLYTLIALAAYGAPFNPLEFVAFMGSVGLVLAGYVSLFRPYAAARIALIASLLVWGFYGPAIAKLTRARFASVAIVTASPQLSPASPI